MADKSRYLPIKKAVMSRIESLNLYLDKDGVQEPANLVVMLQPFDPDRLPGANEVDPSLVVGEIDMPMIQITPTYSESFNHRAGSTRFNIGYPVQITIVDASNQDLFKHDDEYNWWREEIIRAFSNQTLPGVDQVWTCTIEPQQMVNTDAFLGKDLFISAVVIRCHERRQANTVIPDPIALPA